jgi:aryl-alcohol dehydrogenase
MMRTGAGKVLKVGSKVTNAQPGDHVVISYTSCGDCKFCNKKQTSFCNHWEVDNFGVGRRDGSKAYASKDGQRITSHFFGQSSFSKLAIVMGASLVKVPEELPLEKLAPLGCGMMTGAGGKLVMILISERNGD